MATSLWLGSCKKASEVQPESHVPEATQTGRGVLYFKMDGKDYPNTYWGGIRLYDYGPSPAIRISAHSNQAGKSKSVILDCDSISGPGIYRIGVKMGQFYPRVVDKARPCRYDEEQRWVNSSGWVHISRLDRKAGICSGTFEVKVWNKGDVCDTIRITHGVFDLSGV